MELVKGLEVDFVAGQVVLKGTLASEYGSIELSGSVPLIAILKMAAAKTDNKIDDQIVSLVEKALAE